MKCPVCDQENSTMLCSQCGFDASRDYERYPTFGPVGRVPSVSAKKNQPSQEHKLMLELQSARDQIGTLKREQRILTDSLIPENRQLKERILSLANQTKELSKALQEARNEAAALKRKNDSLIPENQQLKEQILSLTNEAKELDKTLQEARNEAAALKHEKDRLAQNLGTLRNRNNYLGQKKNELKQTNDELMTALTTSNTKNTELEAALKASKAKNAELEAALQAANTKNAELEAALKAEQNKGVIARIFNR